MMNKLIKAALPSVLLLFANNLLAKSNYDPLAVTAYTQNQLSDAVILSVADHKNDIYMAGERGILVKASNGSWEQETLPVSVTITKLVSTQDGLFAIGHSGAVLNKSEGGEWAVVMTGTSVPEIYQNYFDHNLNLDPEIKSSLEREVESFKREGPDKPFFELIEIEKGRYHLLGAYGMSFEIEKVGDTFEIEPISHRFIDNKYMHLYSASYFDGAVYVVGEQGTLYKSINSGETYDLVESPYTGTFFGSDVVNEELYVYGMKGNIFKKSTLGDWLKVNVPTESSITSVESSKNGIFILTQSGDVFSECDTACKVFTQINIPASDFLIKNSDFYISTFSGPKLHAVNGN